METNAIHIIDARPLLAEFFEEQADWRHSVDQQFPDDLRNANSSVALRTLADMVRRLPADHHCLVALGQLHRGAELDCLSAGENAGRFASHFGSVGGPVTPEHCEAFLEAFTALVEEDWEASRES